MARREPQAATSDDTRGTSAISVMTWHGTDEQLLELARQGSPVVASAVYDRFAKDINRLVWRLLGADSEHDDVIHEVLVQVLNGITRVREPKALRAWVCSVTVNTVRTHIRRRRMRRLVQPTDPQPEIRAMAVEDFEGRMLLQATYTLLDRLPSAERIPFILRHVDQRPLAEVAELCDCSLATIKRRLAKADRRFAKLAARDPVLAERVDQSPLGKKARAR